MGVAAVLLAFVSLIALPFLTTSGGKFRPLTEWLYWTFFADVVLLSWLGGVEITPTSVFVGQMCTVYFFAYLLVMLPLIGYLENMLLDRK